MAVSAQNIIQEALEELGVYSPGDTVTAADNTRCFVILNDLLTEWAQEYFYIYQLAVLTVALVSGTAAYAVGPGAAVNSPMPDRIDYGPGMASVVVAAATTLADIVSAIEWEQIYAGSAAAGTPTKVYYGSNTFPTGTINVAPTPNAAGVMTLNGWYVLPAFAALTTVYTLASSASDMIKHNLAIRVKPFFSEAPLNPATIAAAVQGRDALKPTNVASRSLLKRGQPAVPGGASGNRA